MKTSVSFFLILAVCIISAKLTFWSDAGLKQLEADFRAANQAETIEPMLELYCTEGSDELNITHLKGALQYELGLAIEKIEFKSLSGAPEETIRFTHNGTDYGPTLKPRRRMRVAYKSEDRFTSIYTIGKTESGAWKFIAAKPLLATID